MGKKTFTHPGLTANCKSMASKGPFINLSTPKRKPKELTTPLLIFISRKKRLPLRQFPETHRQTCRLIGTTPCYPFRPKSRPKPWLSTQHAVVTRVRWNTEAFISVRAKPSSISDRCMAPIISVNFWPLYMPWL